MMKGPLVLLLLLVAVASAQNDGYSYVAHSLSNFQAADGGFAAREGADAGELRLTADAALLVALHGLHAKISVSGVTQFLRELESSDGGYGAASGLGSTIASTLDAVLAQKNLEIPFADAAKTAAYARSLFESSTGLFSGHTGGGKGDIKSTAQALLTLDTVGQLQSAESLFPSIRDALARHVRNGDHFAFPADRISGESTYWGIVAGSLVGFDFGARGKWVQRFENLAASSTVPGAIAATEGAAGTLETTSQGVHAIALLGETVSATLAARVNDFAQQAFRSLHAGAQAHTITLLTGLAAEQYKIAPLLERADGSPLPAQIVQGTSFRAVVRVDSPYATGGAAEVVGKTTYGKEAPVTGTLPYNADRKLFVSSDLFDTENKMGTVSLEFKVTRSIAPFAPLKLSASLERSIGFGINVQATAKHEASGSELAEGEVVPVGTDFNFDVSLYRSDRKRFTSGDFDVAMVVRDASKVSLHRESLAGKSATDLVFNYKLSKSNLPPPRLLFSFEVSTNGVVHTSHDVVYQLAGAAVASKIQLSSKSVNIGQTETVTMEPGAFPDERTVQPFDFDASRVFWLDLHSVAAGPVTRSIKGETGKNGVSFKVEVTPALESIGTHFLSFRFVSADGADVPLKPYDAAFGDVIEDVSRLNFTVTSQLALTDVSSMPEAGDFFYGNDVSFVFKVKDLVSGEQLARTSEEANVFMSLRHAQAAGGEEFTSATVPATFANGLFTINWKITPNAVRGKGVLVLTAVQDLPIYNEDGKAPVRLEVNVGGEIDVKKDTYSTINPDTSHTVIMATFSLSCRGMPLDNAELVANLRRSSTLVARDLQVSSAADGRYEVSWAGSHKDAPDGHYVLDVYRKTDKDRVVESKGAIKLEPLFTVGLDHDGIVTGDSVMFISPEFLIVAILGVGTVYASLSLQKLLK